MTEEEKFKAYQEKRIKQLNSLIDFVQNFDSDELRGKVVNPIVIFTDNLENVSTGLEKSSGVSPFLFWDLTEDAYRQIGRFIVDCPYPDSFAVVYAATQRSVPMKWRDVAGVTYDYFEGRLTMTKNRFGELDITPDDKIGLALMRPN